MSITFDRQLSAALPVYAGAGASIRGRRAAAGPLGSRGWLLPLPPSLALPCNALGQAVGDCCTHADGRGSTAEGMDCRLLFYLLACCACSGERW